MVSPASEMSVGTLLEFPLYILRMSASQAIGRRAQAIG